MSPRIVPISARSALYLLLGIASVIAAPAACLYPSYTFTEAEPSGGGGRGTSSGTSQTTTTSSGSGGDVTTTSSSPTTSTSTGMGTTEDCTDGVDNDSDGKADCADTDCTVGFACHNPVPDGWTGHYALADGALAALPGNCPGSTYPNPFYTGYRLPNAPAPTCSTCSCGAPAGQTCSLSIHVAAGTCANFNSATGVCQVPRPVMVNGSCDASGGILPGGKTTCSLPVNSMCPNGTAACHQAVYADAATLVGGACPPNVQNPTIVPFSWNNAARACQPAAEGAGCANSFACLPNAPAPFGAICISHVGDIACPIGSGYTLKKTFNDLDPVDDRACSDCQCSAVNGASCSTTTEVYSDSCLTKVATLPPAGCVALTGNPAVLGRKSVGTTITAGSCAPSGGQAMGAAVGQNPTTFCCQ